jgi:hypothetical protein
LILWEAVAAQSVVETAPEGAIVALVHVRFGIEAIPLIRAARERKVRILCVDRWRSCLGYIKEHAIDCYGHFALYQGSVLEAAKACKDETLEAVCYLRGQPNAEEWAEWILKTKRSRVYVTEGHTI